MSGSENGMDTEKGFGTGLRAQLAQRRNGSEEETSAPTVAEPPAPVSTEPAFVVYETGNAEALKEELRAVTAREQELRGELAELQSLLDSEREAGHSADARSTEIDARAAKVAALQASLEERERELAARAEAAASEQQ